MKKANNVDEYISTFPEESHKRLVQLRETIKKLAPEAEETISYGMPAWRLSDMYYHEFGILSPEANKKCYSLDKREINLRNYLKWHLFQVVKF